MDSKAFDQLTRVLSHSSDRRGVLRVLASLPLLGGLAALIDGEKAEAKGRRAKPHHEAQLSAEKKRKKKKRKKKCKPQSLATTCAGKCGMVTNNCKKTVDCGSDSCEPGTACFAGICVICGLFDDPCCPGDTCLHDTLVCLAGTCQDCGFAGHPCCAGETCQPGGLACVEGTCEFTCGLVGLPCCVSSGHAICIEGACSGGVCQF